MWDLHYRASRTLAQFHVCDDFVRGVVGPVGSGKSVGCVIEVVARCVRQAPQADGVRRSRWGVIRQTFPELKTTTIATWQDWVPDHICRLKFDSPISGRLHFPLPDGTTVDAEILFLAIDIPADVKKLLSLELTGIWINEAREAPRAVLDMAQARVGRYPAKRDGGCTWRGVIADTNPPDVDHWWYRLFVEERPEGWSCFHQPGGLSPQAENIENLDEGYYQRISGGKDEEWIRVYVHGEYGYIADGKPVYPEFKMAMHVARGPLEPHPKLPVGIGIDFGLTPAAVFGQRGITGRWQWLRELVTEDMGAVRFAELLSAEVQRHYSGFELTFWGDPAGDQRAQTDEVTPFQILRARGIPARPAPTNDFVLRREAVAVPLTRLIDGEPGLILDPRMTTTVKGMSGGYSYRRLQVPGEERYQDKPNKNRFSHCCFVAGTAVSTETGRCPIEAVRVGDRAWTPSGLRTVTAVMCRDARSLLRISVSNGDIIVCTPEHPFAAPGGRFIPAGQLQPGDRLVTEGEAWAVQPFIRSRLSEAFGSTGSRPAITKPTIESTAANTRTAISGNCTSGLFRRVCMFTTATAIVRTTASRTSSWLRRASTTRSTVPRFAQPPNTWRAFAHWLRRHTAGWRAPSAPATYPAAECWPAPSFKESANTVAGFSRFGPDIQSAIALRHAGEWPERHAEMTTRTASAGIAGQGSASTNTPEKITVRAVAPLSRGAQVYNLTVDEEHVYYVEGVLVSNCDAAQYLMVGEGEGRALLRSGAEHKHRGRARHSGTSGAWMGA